MLAFGLVLTLADLVVYVGARNFLRRDLDAQLRTLAGTELASAVDEPWDGVHLHDFPFEAGSLPEFADKFVQLIDAQGVVLLQSPILQSTPSLLAPDVIGLALQGQSPLADVVAATRPGRMIGLASQGPERYVIAVGLFTDNLEATLRQLRTLLLSVWVGAVGLTAVVGFTLASRALMPVRRITEKAAFIAAGQFATRLDVPKVDDEIGRMTRLLNEMLERLHGALEASQRFAADASHELRGPLTAMLGEIDVALKRDRSADDYRQVLDRLLDRLHVMVRLTEDLMLLVRAQEQQVPAVGEVGVADILNRVVRRQRDAAAEHRISLDVDAPSGLVAYADAGLLERVFDNLVTNAIQYNHDDGTVQIEASVRAASAEWAADQVVITVQNSGATIPAEERERVFERFHRLDPSRSRRTGGAGLGLAISREIVRLFKGTIRVTDGVGPGTTIEVCLPGGLAVS